MFFDTHAHLDDEQFSADADEVICGLNAAGIGMYANIGSDVESSKKSLEFAEKYPFVYAAVGIHPEFAAQTTEKDIEEIARLAAHPKAVAIGEIGLDYHYDNVDKNLQKKVFQKQIELAKKYNKTIVIHSRDAAQDTLDILKKSSITNNKVVMHCYSYSKEMAYEFIKMNIKLGIGGVLTFKNAHKLKDIVEELSLNNFLLETDSPYLTPEPHRGEKNEPCNVIYVAKKIAELKNLPLDEVLEVTTSNAICQFDLKLDL